MHAAGAATGFNDGLDGVISIIYWQISPSVTSARRQVGPGLYLPSILASIMQSG